MTLNDTNCSGSLDEILRQGKALFSAKEYDQAIQLFHEALKIDPMHSEALYQLPLALLNAGRIPTALKSYQYARRILPKDPDILNDTALCYGALGDKNKAVEFFNKALKLRPASAKYLYNLALTGHQNVKSSQLVQLHALYASPDCKGHARVFACFALGKIYEDRKEPQRAFAYYAEANSLRFSLFPYEESKWFAFFDSIKEVFNAELLKNVWNTAPAQTTPIFVLGMPRSGTSLVEQILASHSMVYGAGEVELLAYITDRLIQQSTGQPFPQAMNSLGEKMLAQMAELYLQRLRSYCPDGHVYIVDKTPNNFFLVGLIHLLFPHSPIIHCMRDPMDNCWSLFKQLFFGSHPYCYDQAALGRYYRHYQHLMNYWHRALPGRIHDVSYEHMVQEPEATIRAMLDYCRLPWEENCLRFHQTKRIVNTASMQQVRRPIYSSAIKSWEAYAEELTPLRMALE